MAPESHQRLVFAVARKELAFLVEVRQEVKRLRRLLHRVVWLLVFPVDLLLIIVRTSTVGILLEMEKEKGAENGAKAKKLMKIETCYPTGKA